VTVKNRDYAKPRLISWKRDEPRLREKKRYCGVIDVFLHQLTAVKRRVSL
jgi:hypothetical protein